MGLITKLAKQVSARRKEKQPDSGGKGFLSKVTSAIQKSKASTPTAKKRTGGFGGFIIDAAANNKGKRNQSPSGFAAKAIKAFKSTR